MRELTQAQTDYLLEGVHTARVRTITVGGGKQASYLTQADVKRVLIVAFGFGGFSIEVRQLRCLQEVKTLVGKDQHDGYEVSYLAVVRLIIGDPSAPFAYYEDTAVNSHIGSTLADLHDNAAKSAVSEAMKRAAVNLGDQFGLSLYFDGRTSPVVNRVLVGAGTPRELTDEQTDRAPDEDAADEAMTTEAAQ